MDRHSEHSRETSSSGPVASAVRIVSSTPRQFREEAVARLAGGSPSVLVARSRPAAQCLATHLGGRTPSHIAGAEGDGNPAAATGRAVAFYHRETTPAARRKALEAFLGGRARGIILDPEALADTSLLEILINVPDVHWIIQDAQAAFVESGSFQPDLCSLLDLLHSGAITSADLHVSPFESSAAQRLAQTLGTEIQGIGRPLGDLSPVTIRATLADSPLETRAAIADVVTRLNAGAEHGRALFVTAPTQPGRSPAVPATELASVAEEVGFRVPDTEINDATREGTPAGSLLEDLGQSTAAVSSQDPDIVHCLPEGPPVLFLRFLPPPNAGRMLDECLRIAESGGGTWAFAGTRPSQPSFRLSREQVSALGAFLVETCAEGSGPVPLTAEDLAAHLEIDGHLDDVAPAIERVLWGFVGAGLLRSVRRVAFMLEVADAHRFHPPHIDIDPRYGHLREKYAAALAKMDLLQSVQYRLESRPPKDLRVVSKFLGYSIHQLNTLFSDLSDDGIVLCRLFTSGSQGNLDFEVEAVDAGSMAENLEKAVFAAVRWLDQAERAGWELLARLAAQGTTTWELLEAAGGEEAPAVDPKFLAWLHIGGSEDARPSQDGLGEEKPPPSEPRPVPSGTVSPETPAPAMTSGQPANDTTLSDISRFLTTSMDPTVYTPEAWEALMRAVHNLPDDAVQRAHVLITSGKEAEELPWPNLAALLALLADRCDPNEAAVVLEKRLRAPSSPASSPWLPAWLNLVDYRGERPDGAPVADLPQPVRNAALVLPAVEDSPDDVPTVVQKVGFDGTCHVRGLGEAELAWDDDRVILIRHNLDPDTEARLWLAVADGAAGSVAPGIIAARLSVCYAMVAGLAEPSLTRQLAEHVADMEDSSLTGTSPRHLAARARALMELDRTEEALALIEELTADVLDAEGDLRQIRLEILVSRGDHLKALGILPEDIMSGSPTARQARRIAEALQSQCAAEADCGTCPLKSSRFCPPGEDFLAFVLRNPLGESPLALVERLNRRAGAQRGLVPENPKQLIQLVDAFGNSLEEAVLDTWVGALEVDDPGTWLALGRKLVRHGRTETAMRIADRVEVTPDNPGILWRLARLKLEGGRLREALGMAVQLEAKGGRTWSPTRFCADLDTALGRGWEARLETFADDLNAEEKALLQRLAELSNARKTRAQRRARLDAALERGSWRELREALDAYVASDPNASRDRLVREATRRLDRRKRRLEHRVRQVVSNPAANRGELERLARDTEALGMADAHAQVQEALARIPARTLEAPREGGRDQRARSSTPERGRGGRKSGHVPPSRQGQRAGERRPDRRFANGQELIAALESADNDRARVRMTMSMVEELMDTDAQQGLKVLRDALATFQYPDVMDRPLSRLIRSGKPSDEFLPRLRRLLENFPGGRGFQTTIGEISTREHPEPWKQVLAQLKLKS